MAIDRILIVGNWEPCLTIINALFKCTSHGDNPEYQVTVLTYRSQTLILPHHVSPSYVQHKTSDFSPASLQEEFTGHDLIISTTSSVSAEQQIHLIDAAVTAGVRRFIPCEFAHDTLNKQIQARLPKYAARADVINYLRSMSKSHLDFEWSAVATGYTLDVNLIGGDFGFDMEWHSATINGTGTEPFAVSSLARIGDAVTSVIRHWDEVKSQYLYAASVVTTANEVLRYVEKTTGREYTVGYSDVEECVEEAEKRIKRGFPDSGMFLFERSIVYDVRLDASAPFASQSANKLLQLPPESVEVIVEKAYHELKYHGKPGCGCSS